MLKGSRLWAVIALCVLSGSGWILVQAWPSQLGYPFAGCIHFALIGVVGCAVAVGTGRREFEMGKLAAIAAVGVGLFVLPAAVLQFTAGTVGEVAGAAVFAAIPLMTVIYASYAGDGASAARGLFMPSLVGLGGALLLFPVEPPRSVRGWIGMAAIVGCGLLVSISGVWINRLLNGSSIASAAAAIGLAGAVVLGVYGAVAGWPAPGLRLIACDAARCFVFDLPLVWLTVWLMREVKPVRLAARFLLAPLVTVVEGYALAGVVGSFRDIAAMVLLLAGGWMLLVRDEPDEVRGISLR